MLRVNPFFLSRFLTFPVSFENGRRTSSAWPLNCLILLMVFCAFSYKACTQILYTLKPRFWYLFINHNLQSAQEPSILSSHPSIPWHWQISLRDKFSFMFSLHGVKNLGQRGLLEFIQYHVCLQKGIYTWHFWRYSFYSPILALK